jgi:hypothetical protein
LSDLIRSQTPEEKELEVKQRELDALENELADKVLTRSTLEAELQTFEAEYARCVGVKYAELDELLAEIAEAAAKEDPEDLEKQESAQTARQQAEETAEAAGQVDPDQPTISFEPSRTLKDLFRKLVKKYHPDKGKTQDQKDKFAEFFKAINEAYKAGDEVRLRELEREIESSPDSITGESLGDQLIKAIRMIAQVRNRIEAETSEIEQLKQSELNLLRQQVEEAKSEGRDLLAELAAQVQQEIDQAKESLNSQVI